MNEKKCKLCGIMKPFSEFWKKGDNKDGHRNRCISCCSKVQKKYRVDPERERKYNLKKKYGITPEEYDEMLKNQNGVCKICGTDIPKGKGRFHIDHCHRTDKIRGLLCNNCNSMLGFINDNSFILIKAIRYLSSQTKSETQDSLVRETSGLHRHNRWFESNPWQ